MGRSGLRPLLLATLISSGCTDDAETDAPDAQADTIVSPTIDTSATDQGGEAPAEAATDAAADDADAGPPPACPTEFTFRTTEATNVRIAGEWSAFDLTKAEAMAPDGTSGFKATVSLPPGLHAYKLVYDQGGSTKWVLDPAQARRKYVGGVENSAVKIKDCRLPSLRVEKTQPARTGPGSGTYAASLIFRDGVEGSGADAAGFTATLERDGTKTPLTSSQLTVGAGGNATISLSGLADGKYRVVVRARSKSGRVSEPLRLVFWIEAEAFSWKDALIYMIVTDRYRNGDTTNDPAATSGADPRGDYQGGDLEGIRKAIADGTLDKLGVRALWLTPFGTNPTGAYLASDGVHKVTGYHGYWPIKGREVDPRIGGAAALAALVKEAHAHGIRILKDYVVNHVHEEHEYFKAHPEWFRTGCVCGTSGCDWTARALDCLFATYLPDINHGVPAANAQFVDDGVWWLEQFDLDGLRVDAVKHVEEVATRNLAAEVRETFEPGGTKYFLMGETAMGWSDCADPCNDENYGTIAKYMGPQGLDGQFDFVLYHGVSYRTFAYGDKGMLHADYWTRHGLGKWPADAIMTPYIGSHDTARFTTLADYRGQDSAHDRGIPGNQWSNIAVAPTDAEAYARTRIGMAWLLGLPGAPLLYYGDEYGQWGGADPNNRVMWRAEGALTAEESATLSFVRKLGIARKNIAPLRRGTYVALSGTTDDVLVFARKSGAGDAAIVAVSRAGAPTTLDVDVAGPLGFAAGTVLKDALGGPNVTVASTGKAPIVVPAKGATVLSR
ncbi:MAG: glycosyl hydrolase [Deltaproteobacteria bacterium]|nr:glycosyl hydrolase [Deltaproteobacteria bacterium]